MPHDKDLRIGSFTTVSKLYDDWCITQDNMKGRVDLPYSQISPYFQIQPSSNKDDFTYVVAPIINTTTQFDWEQLKASPNKRFIQVEREERVIPEHFLTPIETFLEGWMNNLQFEIKRFEFKAKNDAGGWCNLRVYAKFSDDAAVRAKQLLGIMKPNVLENDLYPEIPLILVLSEVIGVNAHGEAHYSNGGRTVINGLEQALTDASAICQHLLGRQWDKTYVHLPTRGICTALGIQDEEFDLINITQAPKTEGVTLTRAYPRHRYSSIKFVPSSRQYLEDAIGCKFAPVIVPNNTEDVNGN